MLKCLLRILLRELLPGSESYNAPRSLSPSTDPQDTAQNLEARKLLHAAAVEDFKIMRTEILTLLVEYKKVVNLTVLTLPLIATTLSYASSKQITIPPVVTLLGSLFYVLLLLYILQQRWAIVCISSYVEQQTVPLVRGNLAKLADIPESELSSLMAWEGHQPQQRHRSFIPLEMSTIAIPALPAGILLLLGIRQELDIISINLRLEYVKVMGEWPILSLMFVTLILFTYACGVALYIRKYLAQKRSAHLRASQKTSA